MSTPMPSGPSATPSSRARPVWPYLLIAAGVVLLAANLGWLSVGVIGRLLSLWPVALIAVGADLLTGGRYRLQVIVVAVVVAVVWAFTGVGGTGERVEVDHPLEGARAGEVTLRLGVGDVSIDVAAPTGSLASGTIDTGRGETISQRLTRSGAVARLEIASQASGSVSVGPNDVRRWSLSLSRAVPLDLRVHAGVGRNTLDLRSATLSDLAYAAGVGETTVTLPERGGYAGVFELGVGATTVRIPEGVEARVTVRSGLGRVNVAGTFSRDDDVYTTPGYADAAPGERIELTVQGGVGAVTVQRVR
ncbi:MAG: LiaI-LiaF-like domain-containing protein [Trueperaceae bacterium]